MFSWIMGIFYIILLVALNTIMGLSNGHILSCLSHSFASAILWFNVHAPYVLLLEVFATLKPSKPAISYGMPVFV